MKISITAEIGDGPACENCGYFLNGGAYCKLFRQRMETDQSGRPERVPDCLEAVREARQMELFRRGKNV